MTSDSSFFGVLRPVNKCLEVAVFQKCWYALENNNQKEEQYERLIKTHIVMDLRDNELNLNDGRFRNFDRFGKYDREIVLTISPYGSDFSEKIDWIGDYVNHKWSLSVLPRPSMADVGFFGIVNLWDGKYTTDSVFRFENKIDAGYFAIRWR